MWKEEKFQFERKNNFDAQEKNNESILVSFMSNFVN